MNNANSADVKPVSGFAKKRWLEDAGYSVTKLAQQGHAPSDQVWAVTDASDTSNAKPIIAYDRLQGVAVNKAIEALGGM